MEGLPSAVNIYGLEYRIVGNSALLRARSERGRVEYDLLTIEIDEALPLSRQRLTLLHEIIHTLYRLRAPDEQTSEEQMALILSVGLYDCLQRNPEVAGFLIAGEAKAGARGAGPVREAELTMAGYGLAPDCRLEH